jgi:hypothetical protein
MTGTVTCRADADRVGEPARAEVAAAADRAAESDRTGLASFGALSYPCARVGS